MQVPARFASSAASGWNLVFLGAPGVGKGTFAARVAKRMGIPAISTGDIIRAEIKAGSPLGMKIKEYSNSGRLVPDEVVNEMVKHRLSQADAQKGYILVSIKFYEDCLSLLPSHTLPLWKKLLSTTHLIPGS